MIQLATTTGALRMTVSTLSSGIGRGVVFVEEDPAVELESGGARARGGDQRGVVGQRPLGPDLGDVLAAAAHGGVEGAAVEVAESESRGAFLPGGGTGLGERGLEGGHFRRVAGRNGFRVEEREVVAEGVVQAGDEDGVVRDGDAFVREQGADIRDR